MDKPILRLLSVVDEQGKLVGMMTHHQSANQRSVGAYYPLTEGSHYLHHCDYPSLEESTAVIAKHLLDDVGEVRFILADSYQLKE